jgi:hypothetical protein
MSRKRPYRVAVLQWKAAGGVGEAIADELFSLGHRPVIFYDGSPVPEGVDVVFSFGPYGKFLAVPRQLARLPLFVHWNTEGLPDLRIPWPLVRGIGSARSWIERQEWEQESLGRLLNAWPLSVASSKLKRRLMRYRYVGDYYYAYQKGWMQVFADSSAIYAGIHSRNGLPTVYAPWGATRAWYADLGLERDIDVLWLGKRGTRRRSTLLDRVKRELEPHGVRMHIADGREQPFIFGDERTEFANRAKITLNLTRTWYDDNFSRFAMIIPNRSLIISEPLYAHCSGYKPGLHYVSAPIDQLSETILYYLEHEDERREIVERAYQMVTRELTFNKSIETIMGQVQRLKHRRVKVFSYERGQLFDEFETV